MIDFNVDSQFHEFENCTIIFTQKDLPTSSMHFLIVSSVIGFRNNNTVIVGIINLEPIHLSMGFRLYLKPK